MNYEVTNHIEQYKVTSQEEHLSVVEHIEKVEVTSREVVQVNMYNMENVPAHTHTAADIQPTSLEWGQFETILFS